MTGSKFLDVLGSIVVVAGITAAVLPGRQTANVITAFGNFFNGSLRTAISGR